MNINITSDMTLVDTSRARRLSSQTLNQNVFVWKSNIRDSCQDQIKTCAHCEIHLKWQDLAVSLCASEDLFPKSHRMFLGRFSSSETRINRGALCHRFQDVMCQPLLIFGRKLNRLQLFTCLLHARTLHTDLRTYISCWYQTVLNHLFDFWIPVT